MKFTLAHFSDVHLGPLPVAAGFSQFHLKRLIGIASWKLKRERRHLPKIANALRADILLHRPDHIACTGDMVNIAAQCEFGPARKWLMEFGSPDTVSYVPGNHDAYVPIPFENGLAHFADYMQGDMRSGSMVDGLQFPYVRLRRNIALIGLNTGQPQALHRASGTLGAQQLRDLALALDDLKQRGYCRVVLIHHPPLPGMTPDRRALTDAQGFADVLKSSGAEMVLFGHNHQLRADYFDGPSGRIPVLGVSSASMRPIAQQEAAAWRLFSIDRAKGKWQIRAMERKWSEETQSFATIAPFSTVN